MPTGFIDISNDRIRGKVLNETGRDRAKLAKLLDRTRSGTVAVNETVLHAAVEALNRLRFRNASADQAAITDALMNPERFAHYNARVSPADAEKRRSALSAMIRRQLITQPLIQRAAVEKATDDARDGYARGGPVLDARALMDEVQRSSAAAQRQSLDKALTIARRARAGA